MAMGNFDREELDSLLESRQFRKLRETMADMNEVDIAEFVEEQEPEKKVLVFRMLPKELAADVFSFLEVEDQEHIINSITDYELGKIIEDLYVDDAVDMLEELPAIVVKCVLQNATPETRNLINQFLQYPENSAGSIDVYKRQTWGRGSSGVCRRVSEAASAWEFYTLPRRLCCCFCLAGTPSGCFPEMPR